MDRAELQFLADALLVAHFAYVLFVLLGLVVVAIGALFHWSWIRNFWFRMAHFLAILVVAAEALLGWRCPLTTWEEQLRERAGDTTYQGTFIAHWVGNLLFYDGPEWVFTVCYCSFGALVLVALLLVPPRWPTRRIE